MTQVQLTVTPDVRRGEPIAFGIEVIDPPRRRRRLSVGMQCWARWKAPPTGLGQDALNVVAAVAALAYADPESVTTETSSTPKTGSTSDVVWQQWIPLQQRGAQSATLTLPREPSVPHTYAGARLSFEWLAIVREEGVWPLTFDRTKVPVVVRW